MRKLGKHEIDVYYMIADLMSRRGVPAGEAFRMAERKILLLREEIRRDGPAKPWWLFW